MITCMLSAVRTLIVVWDDFDFLEAAIIQNSLKFNPALFPSCSFSCKTMNGSSSYFIFAVSQWYLMLLPQCSPGKWNHPISTSYTVLLPGFAKTTWWISFRFNKWLFYSASIGVFNVKLQNLDKTIASLIMIRTFSPNTVQAVYSRLKCCYYCLLLINFPHQNREQTSYALRFYVSSANTSTF